MSVSSGASHSNQHASPATMGQSKSLSAAVHCGDARQTARRLIPSTIGVAMTEGYYAVVHPSVLATFVMWEAKAKWKAEHRQARIVARMMEQR